MKLHFNLMPNDYLCTYTINDYLCRILPKQRSLFNPLAYDVLVAVLYASALQYCRKVEMLFYLKTTYFPNHHSDDFESTLHVDAYGCQSTSMLTDRKSTRLNSSH